MIKKKEFVDRLYDRIHSIEIVDDAHTEVTRSGDPDDEWDRDSTYTSHSIRGFNAAPEEKGEYFDLYVPYEPEFNEDYYVLYVVYSTGDSFGHDEGRNIEFIGLYTKNEINIAKENQKKIEDHYRNHDGDNYDIDLKTPSGQTYTQYTPWFDYFGGLDYTNIETVRRLK